MAVGFLIFLSMSISAQAGGISIDAGLTPAQDRWIFRTQWRYMQRKMPQPSHPEMTAHMMPIVAAYGLRSDLTVMARQVIVSRTMNSGDMSATSSGMGDLLLMAKYKAYRFNSPTYVLGISPTLGLGMPTGANEVSGRKWNLRTGLYVSGRVGTWAADFNAVYVFTGVGREAGVIDDPGDEITAQIAFARQLGFGYRSAYAIAPVVEVTYLKAFTDRDDDIDLPNSGESVVWLSPGMKFTWGSFIVEGLLQIPVHEDYTGIQMERDPTFLAGIRVML
jgi:hypothetical protein